MSLWPRMSNLLLALMGGVWGIASAAIVRRALWAQRPAVVAESLVEPRLDGTVLGYALLVSLAAGVLFGLVPALRVSGLRWPEH